MEMKWRHPKKDPPGNWQKVIVMDCVGSIFEDLFFLVYHGFDKAVRVIAWAEMPTKEQILSEIDLHY